MYRLTLIWHSLLRTHPVFLVTCTPYTSSNPVGLTKSKSKEIPPSMFTGASHAISCGMPQVLSPAYPMIFSRAIHYLYEIFP